MTRTNGLLYAVLQKMFNLYCLGKGDFKSHGTFGTSNQILTQGEMC